MTSTVIKMQSPLQLSVAKQPLACMIFSALELTSGIKILYYILDFEVTLHKNYLLDFFQNYNT